MKQVIQRIFQVVFVRGCLQAGRAAVHFGLWRWLQPAQNAVLSNLADMGAYITVAVIVWLVFRPSASRVGLDWQGAGRLEKRIYLLAGAVLLAMTLLTYFFDPAVLVENLKAVWVVPVFEELVFRGWAWQHIEPAVKGKHAGAITWVVVSVLFALWHIGYTDIFYLRILPANPGTQLGDFLINKVIFTFFFGLAVGIPRWRTSRVYGSILAHGFLNLFGK